MSPRRPPQFPQFRGVVWKEVSADSAVADDPLAEWAYVVSAYPEGLERSRLRDADPSEQQEVICSWFLSNFQPMKDGGDWTGYAGGAIGGSAIGSGPIGGGGFHRYAPEVRTPHWFLEEEFSFVLPTDILTVAGIEFENVSAFWYPREPADLAQRLSADVVIRVLGRLAEAVRQLPPQHPGIGHNSGQAASIAEIADATEGALETVKDGTTGHKRGEHARARLQIALDKLVEGAASEAGKWMVRGIAAALLPFLWDAIEALSRWLGH